MSEKTPSGINRRRCISRWTSFRLHFLQLVGRWKGASSGFLTRAVTASRLLYEIASILFRYVLTTSASCSDLSSVGSLLVPALSSCCSPLDSRDPPLDSRGVLSARRVRCFFEDLSVRFSRLLPPYCPSLRGSIRLAGALEALRVRVALWSIITLLLAICLRRGHSDTDEMNKSSYESDKLFSARKFRS